jgi:hypothetical protein
MPGFLEIDPLMLPTEMYRKDANGNDALMAQFYDQNRIPVTFDQVNPVMYDAITSSEDKNFYTHGGVDLVGTLSALVGNASNGSNRGGSSITQQYVKNVLQQNCEQGAEPTRSRPATRRRRPTREPRATSASCRRCGTRSSSRSSTRRTRSCWATSTSRTSAATSTASAPPPALLRRLGRRPDDRAGGDDRRHGAGAEHLPHRPPDGSTTDKAGNPSTARPTATS